jgi:hypothetical protein
MHPDTKHKGTLSIITEDEAEVLCRSSDTEVKAGQKLCQKCHQRSIEIRQEQVRSDEECASTSHIPEDLIVSFTAVGCSPIKLQEVSSRDKVLYGRQKISQVQAEITHKQAAVMEVSPSSLEAPMQPEACTKCTDLDYIISGLKEKH